MNKPIAVLLAGAVLLAPAVHAQGAQDPAAAVARATDSAARWLAVADAGKWDDSWEQLAPTARSMVGKSAWHGSVAEARTPLGEVKSRKLQSASFTHALPGAPAGDYVVIQYATEFANKPQSVETVVPMRLPDGSWKVSGYFVR